jgi:colanic acid biosynthesis glycosyl transferase WcaI
MLPDGFRIMFAGNNGAFEDFEPILEAADKIKSYPEIRLIVLGDGPMAAPVKKEVSRPRPGGTVHLLDHRPVGTMSTFPLFWI